MTAPTVDSDVAGSKAKLEEFQLDRPVELKVEKTKGLFGSDISGITQPREIDLNNANIITATTVRRNTN